MPTRPVVPHFPANDSTLANLQALSDSVALSAVAEMGWHLYKGGNQTLTAGVTATITFGQIAFDSDGVGTGCTIQTRGIYDCECTLPFSNTASAGASARAWFQVTTGSNNPLGSGVGFAFGRISDLTTGNSDEMSLTFWGTSPGALYPGDQIQVQANVGGTGVTVSASFSNSGNNDLGGFPDGGAYFTGSWISEGP